jgi:hypothetical protein
VDSGRRFRAWPQRRAHPSSSAVTDTPASTVPPGTARRPDELIRRERSNSQPRGATAARLPVSSGDLLHDLNLEATVGHDLLEPTILVGRAAGAASHRRPPGARTAVARRRSCARRSRASSAAARRPEGCRHIGLAVVAGLGALSSPQPSWGSAAAGRILQHSMPTAPRGSGGHGCHDLLGHLPSPLASTGSRSCCGRQWTQRPATFDRGGDRSRMRPS